MGEGFPALSLQRGSEHQFQRGIAKSHTRALVAIRSLRTVKGMKPIHSLDVAGIPKGFGVESPMSVSMTATRLRTRRRGSVLLREAIPFWFAISSPLIGLVVGFLGAWFVTWLTS